MSRPEHLTLFLAIYLLWIQDSVSGRPNLSHTTTPDDVKDHSEQFDDSPEEWPDVTVSARQLEEDLSLNKRGLSGRTQSSAAWTSNDGHGVLPSSLATGNPLISAADSDSLLATTKDPDKLLNSPAYVGEENETNIYLEVSPESSQQPSVDAVTGRVQSEQILVSGVNSNSETGSDSTGDFIEQKDREDVTSHVVDQSSTVRTVSHNIDHTSTVGTVNNDMDHSSTIRTVNYDMDKTSNVSSPSQDKVETISVSAISHLIDDASTYSLQHNEYDPTFVDHPGVNTQPSEQIHDTETLDSTPGVDAGIEYDHSGEPTTPASTNSNVNISQEVGDNRHVIDRNASAVDEMSLSVTRNDVHAIKDDTLPVDADANFHANLDPTRPYNGQHATSGESLYLTLSPVHSTATLADDQIVRQTPTTSQTSDTSQMTRGNPTSEPEMVTHSTGVTSVMTQAATDDLLHSLDLSVDETGPTTHDDLLETDLPTDLQTDQTTQELDGTHKDDKDVTDVHPETSSDIRTTARLPLTSPLPSNDTTTTAPTIASTLMPTLSPGVSVTTQQPDTTLTTRRSSIVVATLEDTHTESPTSPTPRGRTSFTRTLTPLVTGRDIIVIGTSHQLTPGSTPAGTRTTSRSTTPSDDRGSDVKVVATNNPSRSEHEFVSTEFSTTTPFFDVMTDDVTRLPDHWSEVTLHPEDTSPGRTETNNVNLTDNIHSFVELDLAMSWKSFCHSEKPIKDELVEIMSRRHTFITVDQIKVLNKEGQCTERTQEIQVHMYLMDKYHHYDKTLTQTCYMVLNDSNSIFEESITPIIRNRLKNVRIREPSIELESTTSSNNEPPERSTEPGLFSDPGVTIALVLSFVGGCCCAGLITLQVIFRRRNRDRHHFNPTFHRSPSVSSLDSIQLSSVTKSRPNSGLFNPGLDITDCLQPSHPLNVIQLSNFCATEKHIREEFQKLPSRMPRLSVVPTGEEDKNRYANILPLVQTRVKLLQDGPEPRPSYINANYITGPKNQPQYYIATQAPTQSTIHDFWTMVWQQNSRVIIMLTQMEEDCQSKCAAYWPELVGKSAAQKFGDFLIELKQKDVQQEYITSKLEIHHLRKIEKKEVYHYWYTCWPAHGLPEPISLVKLVLDTRPKYEGSGTPLIVHCSPGTGRTGTFIALDLCMRQFEEHRIVDVLKTVYLMRQERAGVIQNKEQYALLYNAINEYATIVVSPVVSAASSATTLHALLSS